MRAREPPKGQPEHARSAHPDEHVKADYKNGTLTVTLPKKEIAKPRQVKVEVSHN
jgi:HSP20 family molecular chaperone IbpA